MNYVEYRTVSGENSKEIPCIRGEGRPTTETEGAIGMFYMDTDTGVVYKCTAVNDGIHTWEPLDIHVTPEMFGAVGDGVADDTDAIARAVASLTDNGTLLLRKRYLVHYMHIANLAHLTVAGGGTILAQDNNSSNLVEFDHCDDLTVHDIKIDGRNQPCRGMKVANTNKFILSAVNVQNVGNTETQSNSIYGIWIYNSHDGTITNATVKSIYSMGVAAGISLSGDSLEIDQNELTVPKNILIDHAHIEDVAYIDDGDGIKILSIDVDANLTVRNSVFVDCAKRALKFQARRCVSQNNTVYVSKPNFATIDFQYGHGKSIDDTIHYNVPNEEIGSTGNGYMGVAVSSQTEVRGLRVTVANNTPALYAAAGSSGMFHITNLKNETEVGDVTIRDCCIDGCSVLVRTSADENITVKRITVENVTVGHMYMKAVFSTGHYKYVHFKNCALLNRPSGGLSIFHGATFDACDLDLTNVATSDTNMPPRPVNITSRIVARGGNSAFLSGSYVYENGRLSFYPVANVNPQDAIYTSGRNFARAKIGDICYRATPTVTDDGITVGYICTAEADATYTRGQWKMLYM